MRVLALSLAISMPLSGLAADTYRPRVGELHPDVTLPTIAEGTPVSLSDYRGRKVLLIHFASW